MRKDIHFEGSLSVIISIVIFIIIVVIIVIFVVWVIIMWIVIVRCLCGVATSGRVCSRVAVVR